MADFGIVTSVDGVDVTSVRPDQIAFSSKYDLLKVRLEGEEQPQASHDRTHGLGYRPYFLCFRTESGTYRERRGGGVKTDIINIDEGSAFVHFLVFYQQSVI